MRRWFFAGWRKRAWVKVAWSVVVLAGFVVGEVALAREGIDDPFGGGGDVRGALFLPTRHLGLGPVVARMARFGVRSGSLPFGSLEGNRCKQAI